MMVEITEIRIKLMEGSEDRLRAFCSITIDQSFVVRDLKIIDGTNGPFVAMPSRKLTGHCNRCRSKNHLRAGYCNHCGNKQSPTFGSDSPQKLYADVAHPINSECREMIQTAVITEFEAELSRAAQPGYRSRYDDDFDAGDYDESDYAETKSDARSAPQVEANTVAKATPVKAAPVTADKEVSFGDGLFDGDPMIERVDQPHDPDALLVRVEAGKPGKAIPPPHRKRDPSHREKASVLKTDSQAELKTDSQAELKTDSQAGSDQSVAQEKPGSDDSFGAGILDD